MSHLPHYLENLESESIHIFREVVATFKNPVLLYSIGKDSAVMVRLAQKAFSPAPLPFSFLHIDTGYKFPEMIAFRDAFCAQIGAKLIIYKNQEQIDKGVHPTKIGIDKCCGYLKTSALLDAINKYEFDAAFGGARREEEKSRAKERVFSVRDKFGQWDPKNQRPELWDRFNSHINEGNSVRVFPLSNWTEKDIWTYILLENIPVVPLYFSKIRSVIKKKGAILPVESLVPGTYNPSEVQNIPCRFRSLGCSPCTGAVESVASNLHDVLDEVIAAKKSERENRIIDLTSDSSMEQKKKEGYF